MDVKTIETLAAQNQGLPDGLTQPEQLIFLALRYLHNEYKQGRIDKNQAAVDKMKLLKEFEVAKLHYDMYSKTAAMRNRLRMQLSKININGCEYCRKVIEIFDRRDEDGK